MTPAWCASANNVLARLRAALALAAACAACSRPSPTAAPASNPMRTERWLDAPERLIVASGASTPGTSGAPRTSRRWSADQVAREFQRSETGAFVTLRSPPLDFDSPAALDSVLIRFSELGGPPRLALLWG